MSTATHRGTLAPLRQRFTGKFSPTSGFTYDQEWQGFDLARMQALANVYANSGCEYELMFQSGKATLRTTDTRGNITIDTWEIGVNQALKSVLANPLIQDEIPAAYLEIIALAVRDGKTLQQAHDELEENTGDTYADDIEDMPAAIRLYKRMYQGQDSFFFDQYCLRHTTNVSNRYEVNIADLNKGCIYTPSQLLGECQDGSLWVFPLPGRLVYKIQNIFSAFPIAPADYLAGALKGASSESTAANNRVNIVTEWKFDNWPTDIYSLI